MKIICFFLFAVFNCSALFSQINSTKRVADIIQRMTIKEKIDFIGGYKDFNIRGMEKYGIPEIHMADGPVGIRNNGTSTAFSASIALAASWDTLISHNVGQAIAMEAKSKNIHVVFGPGMNICRSPLNGRNFEYMGEDPYLAGEIASSYIVGMQSEGVVATAKHYAANFMEYNKHKVSSDIDERTLREIYLPAFRACVEKGKVGFVMSAYNLLNGEHCTQNSFINNQILKKEWNFQGVLISDWESTYNSLAVAKNGLDLEMPSGKYMNVDSLLPTLKDGRLSEEVIDDKVRRILMQYERFHFFDNPTTNNGYILNEDVVKEIALNAVRGSITLLKNDNKLLPLNTNGPLKIAIIGPNATPAVTGGGGSSYINPSKPMSLLESFKKIASKNAVISYSRGIYDETDLPVDYFKNQTFYTYIDGKKTKGVAAEIFDDIYCKGNLIEKELIDNIDVDFTNHPFNKLPKNNFAIRFTYFVKTYKEANYKFVVSGEDSYRLMVNGILVLNKWENLPNKTRYVNIVLKENSENKVELEYFQKETPHFVRSGYNKKADQKKIYASIRNKAIELASNSDVVILSVGFNNETEGEGMDRTFEMPDDQDKLIEDIAAVNKNCVVVVNAGGNIQMNWINKVAGLMYAWYPGELGNIAVAEAVFGKINPSGKLPVSLEKKWEDNPTFNSYHDDDNDLHVRFSEGIFLGYRYYDKSKVKPLFPFGYGLSYTTFKYSNIKFDKVKLRKGEDLEVSFSILNTGKYDGAEVSQLYVGENTSLLPRPIKELKGFSKIFIKKGKNVLVKIRLDKSAFSYFNKNRRGWIIEPGKFKIYVGSSSQNILLKKEIEVVD